MELYLVYDDGGDDMRVAGVFTTRQLAERACDLDAYSYQNIVPIELDWLPEWKEADLPWRVVLDSGGEVRMRKDLPQPNGRPYVLRVSVDCYHPPFWQAYGHDFGVEFTVPAKDAEEAIARAKEMRKMLIRKGEYTEDRRIWMERYCKPAPVDERPT